MSINDSSYSSEEDFSDVDPTYNIDEQISTARSKRVIFF